MTIDEVIENEEFEAECMDENYHKQIVKLLEELKVYQQHEIICNKGYNAGYNKAIDDFVNNCSEYYFTVADSQFRPYLRGVNLISEPNINKIAEQLKAGGKNE